MPSGVIGTERADFAPIPQGSKEDDGTRPSNAHPMKSALLLSSSLGLLILPANASTVITFAGGTTNAAISNTFGDNIPNAGGVTGTTVTLGQGTPNIDLTWSATGTGTNVRWEFYTDSVWTGGVGQLNTANTGNAFSVTFTPQAGYGVSIESFNFFSYYASSTDASSTNGEFSFDWAVVRSSDSVTVLNGSTGLFTGGSASPAITVGYVAPDAGAYSLVLTRTGGAGGNANIAVDNIAFSQFAVPEPSAALLGSAGLLGLLRRRRQDGI
ncbi:MAG: hypothetical protein QM755_03635 [Luteolibacter sp.]